MIRPTPIVLRSLAGCGVLENNRNSLAQAQEARGTNDGCAYLDGLADTSDIWAANVQVGCTCQSTVVVGSVFAEHIRNGRATFKAEFDGETFAGRMAPFREHQCGINAAACSDAVTLNDSVLGQTVTNDISGLFTDRPQGVGTVIGDNVAVNAVASGATQDSLVVFGVSEAGRFCRHGNNLTGRLQ